MSKKTMYKPSLKNNAVEKMAQIYRLAPGLPQTFNLLKTQYLQSTIQGSAIK